MISPGSSPSTLTLTDSISSAPNLSQPAAHSVQPLGGFGNAPFSRVITEYRTAARIFIASGGSLINILGSNGIAVDLLLRDRDKDDNFSVSNWACEVLCPCDVFERDLWL